jgi:cobalamin biosynthesis protein CbiD
LVPDALTSLIFGAAATAFLAALRAGTTPSAVAVMASARTKMDAGVRTVLGLKMRLLCRIEGLAGGDTTEYR